MLKIKYTKYILILVFFIVENQEIIAQQTEHSSESESVSTEEFKVYSQKNQSKSRRELRGDKAMDMRKHRQQQKETRPQLEGRELGMVRAEKVEKKRKLHVCNTSEKGEDRVRIGREKVKAARERLAKAKAGNGAEASLTPEQIAHREAKIAKAEKQINALEASVKKEKSKTKKGKEVQDNDHSQEP